MKKIVRVVLATIFAGSCLRSAFAFQSGQHQRITNNSVSLASADCPDIQKFSSLISGWSWGIGGTSNMSGFDETVIALFGNTGNPAEELAHLGDQPVPIDATRNVDGGLTLGAGMRYNAWSFDYAAVPSGELGTAHRFTLAVRF